MTAERTGERAVTRQAVTRFLVASAVLIGLAGVVTVLLVQHVARGNALVVAEDDVGHLADSLIMPAVANGLLDGDPQARAVLDSMLQGRLADGSLVRVKVWDSDGRVVWSDEPGIVGQTFEFDPDDAELLQTGGAHAEVTDLSADENVLESGVAERLVEVYVGRQAGDRSVLVEAYVPMTHIETDQALLMRQVLPLTVGVVVLLGLSLLPLALSLARKVEVAQEDRRRMLVHAAEASDHERRRLVGDLHDGVVQDLTGVAYSLASLQSRLDDQVPEAAREGIDRAAKLVREDVQALRTLMVDLYPADLDEVGLRAAIDDVADPLRTRGVDVRVDVDGAVDHLPTAQRALLYRSAREALVNVAKHAVGARRADVRLALEDDTVALTVQDDGPGPGAERPRRPGSDGHMGLGLLRDTLADIDGDLRLEATPGAGTRMTVRMPVRTG